jgi:hypothetical protein
VADSVSQNPCVIGGVPWLDRPDTPDAVTLADRLPPADD